MSSAFDNDGFERRLCALDRSPPPARVGLEDAILDQFDRAEPRRRPRWPLWLTGAAAGIAATFLVFSLWIPSTELPSESSHGEPTVADSQFAVELESFERAIAAVNDELDRASRLFETYSQTTRSEASVEGTVLFPVSHEGGYMERFEGVVQVEARTKRALVRSALLARSDAIILSEARLASRRQELLEHYSDILGPENTERK